MTWLQDAVAGLTLGVVLALWVEQSRMKARLKRLEQLLANGPTSGQMSGRAD